MSYIKIANFMLWLMQQIDSLKNRCMQEHMNVFAFDGFCLKHQFTSTIIYRVCLWHGIVFDKKKINDLSATDFLLSFLTIRFYLCRSQVYGFWLFFILFCCTLSIPLSIKRKIMNIEIQYSCDDYLPFYFNVQSIEMHWYANDKYST